MTATRTAIGAALFAICAAICTAGCGGAAPQVRKPAPFHLEITAGKDTNHGGPLYVVVRKLDQAGFLADDYDAIADRLFAEPRDPSVLRKVIVRPGQALTVDADRDLADGEILGVYFLFSVPGDNWRLAIADRALQRIRIVLGASGIVSAEPR
jgi:predicted component of type VI protein secretion system